MEFEPAVAPQAEPTELAWTFAFVAGQLLLPEDAQALSPGPPPRAEVRHRAICFGPARCEHHRKQAGFGASLFAYFLGNARK